MYIRGIRRYELLTWIGAGILLLAWLMQQTYLQETTDRLSKLNSAKIIAGVLHSNDLILQGIANINDIKKDDIQSLRQQITQSEAALFHDLESEQTITKHSEAKANFGFISAGASYSETIKTFAVDEARIKRAASQAWWAFVIVYLVGALLSLSGAVLKGVRDGTTDDTDLTPLVTAS